MKLAQFLCIGLLLVGCNDQRFGNGIGTLPTEPPLRFQPVGLEFTEVFVATGILADRFAEILSSSDSVSLDGYALCAESGCEMLAGSLDADQRLVVSLASLTLSKDAGALALLDSGAQVEAFVAWGGAPTTTGPTYAAQAVATGASDGTFLALPFPGPDGVSYVPEAGSVCAAPTRGAPHDVALEVTCTAGSMVSSLIEE